jgi:hypothetical protein
MSVKRSVITEGAKIIGQVHSAVAKSGDRHLAWAGGQPRRRHAGHRIAAAVLAVRRWHAPIEC